MKQIASGSMHSKPGERIKGIIDGLKKNTDSGVKKAITGF